MIIRAVMTAVFSLLLAGCFDSSTDTNQNNVGTDSGIVLTIDEGTTIQLDPALAQSVDSPSSYQWTQTGGPSGTLVNANSDNPSFTAPQVNADSVLSFSVTTTNANGDSRTQTFSILVRDTQQAPVAAAGPDQNVVEGSSVSLNGSASQDPDGTITGFQWVQTSGPTVTINNANTAAANFIAPQVNGVTPVVITLTVTDNNDQTDSDSVQINVQDSGSSNAPPTANAGPDQTVTEGTTVNLNGSGSSDADGSITSFSWRQTSGPNVTLNGGTTQSPSFTAPQVSSSAALIFELTVTDNGNLTSTDTVRITVNNVADNRPVAIGGPNQVVNERETVTLDGSNSFDQDDDIDSYRWTQVSGPAVQLQGASTPVATFVAPDVPETRLTRFELKVSDTGGRVAFDQVDVTILDQASPTADAGPDQTVDEGSFVTLDGSGSSDPENQTLTYEWIQIDGNTVTLSDPTSVMPTFQAPDNGGTQIVEFRLTVTNPNGVTDSDRVIINVVDTIMRNRYSFNNQCFVLKSNSNGNFVVSNGGGYSVTEPDSMNAERFYLKPSALGDYLLYNSNRQLLTANPAVGNVALEDAVDGSIWTIKVAGDTTNYPPAPQYNIEPTKALVDNYRAFGRGLPNSFGNEPNLLGNAFTLTSPVSGQNLSIDANDSLVTAAASASPDQQFNLKTASGCESFPEASSNVENESLTTLPDPKLRVSNTGEVLGMVDAHVHISSTEFLGRAQWGNPFHKFGVTHALGDCDPYHQADGMGDAVGGLFTMDTDGHDTTGWPTFPEWPARNQLTHEAIYWKWLERSWMAGLRIIVNDVVDNETLCELQRNVNGDATIECNSMTNAMEQVGTMYAMQDYIDAQYGGRGNGWFQVVHDSDEARDVIEEGKAAVILGIEISNLLNCKVNYNPSRMQEPFEEDPTIPTENQYRTEGFTTCKMTETGQADEILTQMQRMHDIGVRQVISIHEFDNAFGGNGIFDGLVLNLGNRENSGGNPGTDTMNPFSGNPQPPNGDTPTGEFWTTYDCPVEGPGELDNDGQLFSGYLFGSTGGSEQEFLTAGETCFAYAGQGGRPGGSTPCYPDTRQCNARWMTPTGLYFYGKLMELGFIFDWDHMEYEMKTQALEFIEEQTIPYPLVSTHGNFGGTSNEQAERLVRAGGLIYPSLGNGPGHIGLMNEMFGVYQSAVASVPADQRPLFGFGFGTDTNGLSNQSGPRSMAQINDAGAVEYPYTLFAGSIFEDLPEFDQARAAGGVRFDQPQTMDPDGAGRTWNLDQDGSAHHGMLSGMVEELRLHGTPDNMRHLFNSAEAYLQMWNQTERSAAEIQANGLNPPPAGILREAPVPDTSVFPPAPPPPPTL